MSFSLPVDVTAQRRRLSATEFEYVFRHRSLGELGRLVLSSAPGGINVTPVLFAPPGDARSQERQAIFEPLARTLTQQLEQVVRR